LTVGFGIYFFGGGVKGTPVSDLVSIVWTNTCELLLIWFKTLL